MQIMLKQNELATAVRAYIQSQGINLSGKAVKVDFVTTRSPQNSTNAEITIEDANVDIPGYTDDSSSTDNKPALTLAAANTGTGASTSTATTEELNSALNAPAVNAEAGEQADSGEQTKVTAKTLFGGN